MSIFKCEFYKYRQIILDLTHDIWYNNSMLVYNAIFMHKPKEGNNEYTGRKIRR